MEEIYQQVVVSDDIYAAVFWCDGTGDWLAVLAADREALCEIMLPDSGYLNEKDVEWKNKKRVKNGKPLLEALYTRADAEASLTQIDSIGYEEPTEILPGLTLTFHDAGHILGSSIVELTYTDNGKEKVLVFSGDLGYRDAPVMNPPVRLKKADVVMMESTYGDRLHRAFDATVEELTELFQTAGVAQGNILIPAFTVGRTQDLLYLMSKNVKRWGLDKWRIFVDSPMGIEATSAYARYRNLYGAHLFKPGSDLPNLPNITMSRSTEESMVLKKSACGVSTIRFVHVCTLSADCRHTRIRPTCSSGMVPLTIIHPSIWCMVKSAHKRHWPRNYANDSMRLSL